MPPAAASSSSPRRRRRSPLPAIALLVLVGVGGYFAYSRLRSGGAGIDIPIPQAIIQKSVEMQFPVKEGRIEARDPVVVLLPGGDRIGMRMEIRAPMLGTTADVEADGRLRYEADSASFFLDDPHVNELHSHGVLGNTFGVARKAINGTLKTLLRSIRIYQIDDAMQKTLAHAALKRVRVENGQVVVTLGMSGK